MPDTDSVTLVKWFTYRDAQEEFSNKYHLDGTTPTSDAEWLALIDALWAAERQVFNTQVHLARGYGYVAGNDHAAYMHDYSGSTDAAQRGSMIPGGVKAPGDAAVTCRWDTGAVNSRGRKIYLRKYFHPAWQDSTDPDKVDAAQLAALNAFHGALTDGSLPGGMVLVGPQGAPAGTFRADPWITTRTLKRRGKRPPTP